MFGIKRRKQSRQADNRMKESGSAAVLQLKCAVAVMPSGDAKDGYAEYKDKGIVTVTDDDRLVLQTKRETMELHLKDVRLYSKANAKDVRLRLPSARYQLLFRNLRDKEAFCGMFQKKPPKEPKEQETPAEGTDDILLIEHHVNGMAGGVPRHIMIQAYYDAQNERLRRRRKSGDVSGASPRQKEPQQPDRLSENAGDFYPLFFADKCINA